MRISEFVVGEFDALRDLSGTLAPRLSVIWGGNESGKTTLSRFFRRLLFADETYWDGAPSNSSGALLVHTSDGRNFKIALDGNRASVEDADKHTPVTLESLLPFDAQTYESVFSINPGLWPVGRWPAGQYAGTKKGAAFSGFITKLDELESGLYSSSDSAATLNMLWDEIKSNDLQIENLKNWNEPYWELRKALEEKRETVKNARVELEKNRLNLARLDLIAKARPAWLEAQELESELESLNTGQEFGGMPKRGLERLDSLQERTADLRRRLDERRRKNAFEASHRRQMENNPVMTLLKYREALNDLEREMDRNTLTKAETAAMASEVSNAEDCFKRELRDVAPHWSEEDLTAADLSLAAERIARDLGYKIKVLNERVEKIQGGKADEESRLAALKAEIAVKPDDTGNLSLHDTVSDPQYTDYQTRRQLLLEVRSEMLRYDALRWEIRGEKMCAELIEGELKSEGSPPPQVGSFLAKCLVALLLSLSGVVVAIGMLAPVFHSYAAYAVLFCVLAALGPVFSIFMAKREHSVRFAQWKGRYERRNSELDKIDERIVEQRREMQIIASSIEHKSQILGINEQPTLSDLDEASRLLENDYNSTADLELKKDVLKQLLEKLEKCESRLNGLKNNLSGATRELNDALESWKNWLLQNRFDPNLSPENFDLFLAGARAARANLKALGVMRQKMSRASECEASIDARISELGARTGLVLDRGGLPALFSSLKEAHSLQARIEASLEERRVTDFECSELERELAAAVGNVRALCVEAGVDNEESLRAAFEKQASRLALENRLAESARILAGILGKDATDIGESEFSALLADPMALAEKTEALKSAITEGERALNLLCDSYSALEAQMNSMVADDQLFTLRQRNETLKVLSQKEFRRWLAVVLLRRLAGKAMERHEKNMEPELLKQARQFLSLMSVSNCKIVPDGKRGEQRDYNVSLLREPDGIQLDETQWSLSLAEQVGLSMRLAMACRLAERVEPLPVMLDDVLACFDESRQRCAIEVLWRASEKLQVIFFTCHRFTVDMFKDRLASEKGFSVVEMSGSTLLKERAGKKR